MFFIVGSARSGTTLLRLLLNAHPDVAVPPESRFVVDLYQHLGAAPSRGDQVAVEEFLTELGGHKRWPSWDTSIEDVRARLGDRNSAPYAEAIEAAYRAFALARGKSRFGDKTPRYIEHIPLLARLWPSARFVHLVRDGREVALSYADVPFGPKTVAKAAALWSDRVAAGLTTGRPLGQDHYLELHYESLLANPQEQVQVLCRFLNLDFTPAMLDYAERSRDEVLERATLYNPNVTRKISRTRSWTEQMPIGQVEVFEAIAGKTLSTLGYQRRLARPSVVARAAAAAGRAGLPVGRLRPTRAGATH